MLIKGANLDDKQKKMVLSAFVHRITRENHPCPDQGNEFVRTSPSDSEWLTLRSFHFRKDGRSLDARYRSSFPAWMAD